MTDRPTCPTCRTPTLKRHCDYPTGRACPWLRCDRCHGYGVPGVRWWDEPAKKVVA